ncbi:DUF2637 domain-containing protein [Actinokineospora auranticolor]|uniref:Uncharacterized protein DUF2637 n=1 Tax=Actinokineospora auranticolor TaxID=155976 RepID=A0A2S6GJ76_9PSEU|nr:DUF2637 domain-containing protein [Actinokineospora auranticolor]PPK65267.1 uncharacterized protein DUF2637 [Actinokineospora auranticolor]
MVSVSPHADVLDADHAAALDALPGVADKIRYACAWVDPPTTAGVRAWLAGHGVETKRSYASSVVSKWRRERGVGDTGNLVRLTPELLAELDALGRDPVEELATVEVPVGERASVAVVDEVPVVARVEAPVRERVEVVAERVAPVAESRVLRWVATAAWLVVVVVALGISWWSLFDYARSFAIPTPLAATVSLVFDAAALIVAGLAQRYASSAGSGAGPRLMMLVLLAGSIYLNWEHAASKGYGVQASIMFAAPAAIGIVLFELQMAWRSRVVRRARGRVAPPLPVIGAWRWVLHPVQNLMTLWIVGRAEGRADRAARLARIPRES